MTFDVPMYLSGDPESAGWCGGCGQRVAWPHTCPPVRRCQYGGDKHPPAQLFDIDGAWCSPECREYDRQSEITIWRRWEQ